jgi:glycosyltransferase involved in cell wall biosynthesis
MHNRAATVVSAINSVLEQSYRNIELIVVDDASTDRSVELVEALDDPRIRVLGHESNRGAPAARNTGIEAAQGDFIAFQDSDDEWMPEKLAKQMRVLETSSRHVGAVYCGLVRIDESKPTYIPGPEVRVRSGNISRELLHGNFVGTPTLVVRRDCFTADNMFWDELPRFQDWELALRLADEWEFAVVDEPLVRVQATEISISSDERAGAKALEMILDRHRERFEAAPPDYALLKMIIARFRLMYGDYRGARCYIWKAIKITPFAFRPWAFYFVSFLGQKIFSKLSVAERAVRQIFQGALNRSMQHKR